MAEDVIQIGRFNKNPAIIAADAKGYLQPGANLSRKAARAAGEPKVGWRV